MRNRLKENVAIAGVGCSRFGDMLETPELKGLSMQEITANAVQEALNDAGMSGQDLDAVYVGNAMVHSSPLSSSRSLKRLRLERLYGRGGAYRCSGERLAP